MDSITDLPPGTEGYEENVPENYNGGNQNRNEFRSKSEEKKLSNIEKFIQSHKIQLDNGTTSPMFSFIQTKETTAFLCYPCGATCHSELSLQDHLNGKKHSSKIASNKFWPASLITNHPYVNPKTKSQSTEDVPDTDKEGNMECQLFTQLKDYKQSPIIGLEYMLEIIKDNSSPCYYCTLCDKHGEPKTVTNHLVGFTHKVKYITIHYPTAFRALDKFLRRKTFYYIGILQVLNNICTCIEQAYGRLTPTVVKQYPFDSNRTKYKRLCAESAHFNERTGETFEELVDEEYITLLSQNDGEKSIPLSDVTAKSTSSIVTKNVVNVKDNIQITLKTTSLNPVDKNWQERDLRESLNEIKARKGSKERERFGGKRNRRSSLDSLSSNESPNRELNRFYSTRGRKMVGRSFREEIVSSSRRDRVDRRSPKWGVQRSVSRERRLSPRRNKSKLRSRSPLRRSRSPRKTSPKSKPNISESTPSQNSDIPFLRDFNFDKLQGAAALTARIHIKKNVHKLNLLKDQYFDAYKILKQSLEFHERNPEKHPLYQEEWKKFWNKRYKELKAENKDVKHYDFKPEWILFWGKRMKELQEIDLLSKRMELCRKLNLPISDDEFTILFNETIEGLFNKDGKKSPDFPKARPAGSPERSKDYKFKAYMNPDRPSRGDKSRINYEGSRVKENSHERQKKREVAIDKARYSKEHCMNPQNREYSPWDDNDNDSVNSVILVDSARSRSRSQDSKPSIRSGQSRSRVLVSKDRDRFKKSLAEHVNTNTNINVVSVLRLLTALENYLGSLGPKIVDLLGVALKMEKNKPNSSDDILLDDTYSVLFETVKEKLKGQLLAGLIENNAVQATKVAIQNTASLIHKGFKLSEQHKKEAEVEKKLLTASPVKVEGIGAFEKAAIANQIAAALVAQGKTNVTTEELESLVNAVVGMANASQKGNTEESLELPIGISSVLNKPKISKLVKIPEISGKSKTQDTSSGSNALQLLQSAYTQQTKTKVTKEPEEEQIISSMDGLSDSDLKTLLQNFKDLSADEQQGLIAYLKKLEVKEPQRVEKLRMFVSVDTNLDVDTPVPKKESSPFSNRMGGTNPISFEDKPPPSKPEVNTKESDDEDDYTFEEVLKSASEKVKEKQLQEELKVVQNALTTTATVSESKEMASMDTKTIISNLMGSLQKGIIDPPAQPTPSSIPMSDAESLVKVLTLVGNLNAQNLQQVISKSESIQNTTNQSGNMVANTDINFSNDNQMNMQMQGCVGMQGQNQLVNQGQNQLLGMQGQNQLVGMQGQNQLVNQQMDSRNHYNQQMLNAGMNSQYSQMNRQQQIMQSVDNGGYQDTMRMNQNNFNEFGNMRHQNNFPVNQQFSNNTLSGNNSFRNNNNFTTNYENQISYMGHNTNMYDSNQDDFNNDDVLFNSRSQNNFNQHHFYQDDEGNYGGSQQTNYDNYNNRGRGNFNRGNIHQGRGGNRRGGFMRN